MEILPVRAELFHADGRTDRVTDRQTNIQTDRQTERHDEANSRFSQFFKRSWKLFHVSPSSGGLQWKGV